MHNKINSHRFPAIAVLAALLCFCLLTAVPAFAQGPAVQEITGTINPGGLDIFMVPGLKEGQTLYVSMEHISGNLDPVIYLAPAEVDLNALIGGYLAEVQRLLDSSEYPLAELPALADRTFLAWDDDSGEGYNTALEFKIPQDGDYILGASGALSSAGRETSGVYRLLIGLDAPEVLSGEAVPGEVFLAFQNDELLGMPGRVQKYSGSLTDGEPLVTLPLYDFDPGTTLYAFVVATSGNLKPILVLRDFGDKPVGVANLQGTNSQASLEYELPQGGQAYSLDIYSTPIGGEPTSGDFRLLAGVDAPEVLTGQAEQNSQRVLRTPVEVQTGLKLQQIVMIDQSNEIMRAVGTIQLSWNDQKLAFSPDECNCEVKEYTENEFNQFLEDTGGDWPDFTFFNQQGNRWTLSRVVQVLPDGSVTYLERFSTDFQLNFDFSKYPFDVEDFYIYADLVYPEDRYVMVPTEGFSEIDPEHGEDEFILTGFDTSVSSVISSRAYPVSRFTFHFNAPRYLMYYLFRIFIPVLLIILISYITFFLKDFTRRIEVATGNVLLFIAFSWSLAEDYPRMGYLTFLDAIMAITFIINTLVVIYNVYLKWLESTERREQAERIDRIADVAYPLSYLLAFGLTILIFFF